MARVTDTRKQVWEIADRILADGGTPTPTLVREMLGKGSPNTIVDALRAWRQERGIDQEAARPEVSKTVEKHGLSELAKLLEGAASASQDTQKLVLDLLNISRENAEVGRSLMSLEKTCQLFIEQLASDRKWMQEELSKVNERFEGVQRRMLLAIDEAREDARKWKEAARSAQEEAEAWKHAQGQRANKQQEELIRLRALIEVYEKRFSHSTLGSTSSTSVA